MAPTPKRAAARTPAIKAQARIRVTHPVISARVPRPTTRTATPTNGMAILPARQKQAGRPDPSSTAKSGESPKDNADQSRPTRPVTHQVMPRKTEARGRGTTVRRPRSLTTHGTTSRTVTPPARRATHLPAIPKMVPRERGATRIRPTKPAIRGKIRKTATAPTRTATHQPATRGMGPKAKATTRFVHQNRRSAEDHEKRRRRQREGRPINRQLQRWCQAEGNDPIRRPRPATRRNSTKSGDGTKQNGKPSSEMNKDAAKGQGNDQASSTKTGDSQKNSAKGQSSTPKGNSGTDDPDYQRHWTRNERRAG